MIPVPGSFCAMTGAADFFTTGVWTPLGLKTYYVLLLIWAGYACCTRPMTYQRRS